MPDHLTPVFRQWRELKQQHPGCLLLFQLGDFYEAFEEDAEVLSRACDLTRTSRDSGEGRRVPMCGIPCHAIERYLVRIVKLGFHVALAEQVEDPRQTTGLVRREVQRVHTPGNPPPDTALPLSNPRVPEPATERVTISFGGVPVASREVPAAGASGRLPGVDHTTAPASYTQPDRVVGEQLSLF